MRQLTLNWFDQFLDDYRRYTKPEYQKSETGILEKFSELEDETEHFAITVEPFHTVDGQGRMFWFYQVKESEQDIMQYDGWVDV